MSEKKKDNKKKKPEIDIEINIEVSEEARKKDISKNQFYKALDKVIESDKKQDSEDS